MWEGLDDKTRENYNGQFRKNLEQYKKDLAAWEGVHGKTEVRERSSSKNAKKGEKMMGANSKKPEKKVEEKKEKEVSTDPKRSKSNGKVMKSKK